MAVRVVLWRKLSTEELTLLNCGLEKTLESPLDCKEIQPVHSEDQSWAYFGRNDAKAETPILCPPYAKSWFTGKDLCSEGLGAGVRGDDRGWDDRMASPTRCTCVLSELRELVMDRKAWRAVIHGVTKGWTWLSDWSELNWTEQIYLHTINKGRAKWHHHLFTEQSDHFKVNTMYTDVTSSEMILISSLLCTCWAVCVLPEEWCHNKFHYSVYPYQLDKSCCNQYCSFIHLRMDIFNTISTYHTLIFMPYPDIWKMSW